MHNGWRLRKKTSAPAAPAAGSSQPPGGGEGDSGDRRERDRAELSATEVRVPSAAEQMQYAFFYVGMLTGETERCVVSGEGEGR